MSKRIVLLLVVTLFVVVDQAQTQTRNDITPHILSMRERSEVMDRWTELKSFILYPDKNRFINRKL